MASNQEAVKAGYKQTELGEIPEDWDVRSLGDIISVKNGYAFKSDFFSKNQGHILLTPGNFTLSGKLYFEERNTKKYTGTYPKEFELGNGDLLLVMTDLTPSCNLLGKPAIIEDSKVYLHNQRIGKVKVKKGYCKEYVYYLLFSDSYAKHIKGNATGSTVRHTSIKDIYSANVIVARCETEQATIAKALSDTDARITTLNALIYKKEQVKQGAMQQLLTGKVRLQGFGEGAGVKQTELGEIPEDWEVVLFARVCNLVASGRSNKVMSSSSFPLYGSTGVIGLCNEADHSGDAILIARVGANAGKTNIVTGEYGVSDNTIIVKLKRNVDFKYIYYQLLKKDLNSMVFGSGQPLITGTQIKNLLISFPPKVEQTAIASALAAIDTDIQILKQRLAKIKALKQGMMQELLTGKTRLVPAAPLAEESTSE